MALGNNLKRVKKDTLIPDKKNESTAKPKAKKMAAAKSKKEAQAKIVKGATPKIETKPKTVKEAAPKKEKKVAAPVEVAEVKETITPSKPVMAANLEEKVLLGGDEGSAITAKLIPSRRKSVRKTKLVFEGSLGLLEAEAIKDCLMTTFNEYDIIDIQLLNITQLDIIPVQMIKTFVGHYPDKKITVDSDLPFDIKIIVERAGFSSFMFKEEVA